MAVFCRVSLFCRVFFSSLPSGLFSALDKEFGMPSAIILPSVVSAALGKQLFCRVPDGMHSANILALGKSLVSGSDCYSGQYFRILFHPMKCYEHFSLKTGTLSHESRIFFF